MTKKDLVTHVATKAKLSKKQAGMAVDAFLGGVMEAMAKREKVSLVGFGTHSAKMRAARRGVNPKDHKQVQYPAKWVPHFKAGKTLKEIVEKGKIKRR